MMTRGTGGFEMLATGAAGAEVAVAAVVVVFVVEDEDEEEESPKPNEASNELSTGDFDFLDTASVGAGALGVEGVELKSNDASKVLTAGAEILGAAEAEEAGVLAGAGAGVTKSKESSKVLEAPLEPDGLGIDKGAVTLIDFEEAAIKAAAKFF